MITKKQIEGEMNNLQGLTSMIEAYEEIAATRIKRTRDSVLKSRSYLSEINDIFQQVKSSYRHELDALMKKGKIKDPAKLSFVQRNGKTLSVFISANTGLYGDIVQKTFDLFIKQIENQQTDVAIIGKLGASLFEDYAIKVPYTYFELSDQNLDQEKLQQIATFLLQYEKVVVYFEQFQSIVKQEAIMSDISGNLIEENRQAEIIKYLFEPSLEKILGFFESEIFSSIFEQTVHESLLAKFASRMINLAQASENTKKRLKYLNFQKEQIKHRDNNRKQLQSISSMSLWHNYS